MPLTFRIYVCSHATDGRIEREHLHAVIFPELRRRLTASGCWVEVVDLRHGTTGEEDAEGPAKLAEAFHKIGECRPWFVCLLGDRVGPVLSPELSTRLVHDAAGGAEARAFLESLPELDRTYPGLLQRLPASRLELEVWQAVLRDDRPAAGLVYCRDGAEADPESRARIERLRSGIEESGRATIRRYTLTEDGHGLTAFGESVLADLSASMDAVRRAVLLAADTISTRAPEPGESMEMTARIVQRTLAGRDLVTAPPSPAPPPSAPRTTPAPPQPDAPATERPRIVDENVQFTVYRPRVVAPEKWYPMLAFAHLSERPLDAPAGSPDPVEEVYRQAKQVLGAQAKDYQDVTQDSRASVPRDGELLLVPEVAGIQFNPPRRSFLWTEPVHREEFRLKANADLDGKTARGRLAVYLGGIILADVSLTFRVDASHRPASEEPEADKARPYRRIFASYSHRDAHVVQQVEQMARIFGDRYLRDWTELRAGEVWDDRLMEMIRQADVFQLFWSHHSMHSPHCKREWEYALSLNRPYFVRPTYWEEPLPSTPDGGLPPEELRRLHFQRVFAEAVTHPQMQPAAAAPASLSSVQEQSPVLPSLLPRATPDAIPGRMPPPRPAAAARRSQPAREDQDFEEEEGHHRRTRKRRMRFGSAPKSRSLGGILILVLLVLAVLGVGVLWFLLGR